jgi:hypothetical protein
MFSIYPPFYYGAFNAVIAFITILVLAILHIMCLSESKIFNRSVYSLFYFFYHILITVWLVVGLIMAYIWSAAAVDQ